MTTHIKNLAESPPQNWAENPVELILRGATVRRGDRVLLHDLHARMTGGDLWIVTGPNGCGKTSLLRAIAGLLWVEDGMIEVSTPVCYLDGGGIDPRARVAEGLLWWARLHDPRTRLDEVDEVLQTWGLARLARARVGELSTGQSRLVRLARLAFAPSPLWLLDEPFLGLDHKAESRAVEHLTAHTQQGGLVVIATPRRDQFPVRSVAVQELSLVAFGAASPAVPPAASQ